MARLTLVTATRFKELHLVRSGALVTKRPGALLADVVKDGAELVETVDDRVLRFTISTGAVDRDRDVIDPKGWELDAFRKNPVTLWAHEAHKLPIGKTIDVGLDGDRLKASVQFLGEGYGAASAFADDVYKLARDGYLQATSVGFRPLSWDVTTDKDRGADDWWPGLDFHTCELCELSLVTVPSNPEALIEPIAPLTEASRAISVNEEQERARASRRRTLRLVAIG